MDPIKKIYRDIQNNIRSALPKIAYEIGDKMLKKYVDCVDAFYGHMEESNGYFRTYSTYLGSSIAYSYGEKHSGSLRNKSGETTTFSIHINMTVSPSYLGKPYKDPTWYVFGRTWSEGIHGTLANPKMSEPPEAKFEKWFESFRNGDVKMITNRGMRTHAKIG